MPNLNKFKPLKQIWFFLLILAAIVNFYNIDNIPSELFGDVIQHWEYVRMIDFKGLNMTLWYGGDGPLFPHIAWLLTRFIGESYRSMKVASALIGIGNVILTYFFVSRFTKSNLTGLYAGLFVTFSFWNITFSHQAKPYILVPFFLTLGIMCVLHKKNFFAGLVFGLGSLTQVSFWGFLLLILFSLSSIVGGAIGLIPIIWYISNFKNQFINPSSYLGEKIYQNQIDIYSTLVNVSINFQKNISALFMQGDASFRHNISMSPHIDPLSFLLVLIGVGFFLKKYFINHKVLSLKIVIAPIILALIMTSLDINNPANNPSMGRTIGLLPILALFFGVGLHSIVNIFKNSTQKVIVGLFFVMVIASINLYKFNFIYPRGLPNKNTPFSKVIIDQIQKDYKPLIPTIMLDCCWGDAGQPEPKSIRLQFPQNSLFLAFDKSFTNESFCQTNLVDLLHEKNVLDLKKVKNVLIITRPKLKIEYPNCLSVISKETISKNNIEVADFVLAEIK